MRLYKHPNIFTSQNKFSHRGSLHSWRCCPVYRNGMESDQNYATLLARPYVPSSPRNRARFRVTSLTVRRASPTLTAPSSILTRANTWYFWPMWRRIDHCSSEEFVPDDSIRRTFSPFNPLKIQFGIDKENCFRNRSLSLSRSVKMDNFTISDRDRGVHVFPFDSRICI